MALSAREIASSDIAHIASYWLSASDEYLIGMGADPSKMPTSTEWNDMLANQIATSYKEKNSFGTVWLDGEEPFGHCNINQIDFGNQASMHLHIWDSGNRKKGSGKKLVVESLKLFFEKFNLKKVICEPYSQNIAPHKTLEKLGFSFVKEYTTIPGSINFQQSVMQWEITLENFKEIYQWNPD